MSAAILRSITEASAGLLFAEASAGRSESWEDRSAIGCSEAQERARPHCLSWWYVEQTSAIRHQPGPWLFQIHQEVEQ
jgi:hypothetical protein